MTTLPKETLTDRLARVLHECAHLTTYRSNSDIMSGFRMAVNEVWQRSDDVLTAYRRQVQRKARAARKASVQ